VVFMPAQVLAAIARLDLTKQSCSSIVIGNSPGMLSVCHD
jgi:hypothetical protein